MIGFMVTGAVISYTFALAVKLIQHIIEVTE